jgi:serine/threonine protein kinase
MHDPNREFLLQLVEDRGLVGDRFRNIQRIDVRGGGGMFSLMFKATDSYSGRPVAIKVFHPERRTELYRMASFDREIAMLSELKGQDGIIQLVSGREDITHTFKTGLPSSLSWDFSYFSMELAEGDVASDILAGGYDPQKSLICFRDLCKSIQRLHSRSIAYRDVKPGNFLRMKGGGARIGDFGTARNLQRPPIVADYGMAWPGDYTYAPPEMIAGLLAERPRLAFLADFFGLGAILFELFTGTPLTIQIYEAHFVGDLMTAMAHVPVGKRQETLDSFVRQLAAARQLPSIADFGVPIPRCIGKRVDSLYQTLCALDYRERLHEYPRIFRQIDAAVIVLRNERKYHEWLREKRRRRAIAISSGRLRR